MPADSPRITPPSVSASTRPPTTPTTSTSTSTSNPSMVSWSRRSRPGDHAPNSGTGSGEPAARAPRRRLQPDVRRHLATRCPRYGLDSSLSAPHLLLWRLAASRCRRRGPAASRDDAARRAGHHVAFVARGDLARHRWLDLDFWWSSRFASSSCCSDTGWRCARWDRRPERSTSSRAAPGRGRAGLSDGSVELVPASRGTRGRHRLCGPEDEFLPTVS